MITITCRLCNLHKETINFYLRDKVKNIFRNECKDCLKLKRVNNIADKTNYNKNYYNLNKEAQLKRSKDYYYSNKDKVIKYKIKHHKQKLLNDPSFKIRKLLSTSISRHLQTNFSIKNGKSILDYLPYSIEELKIHLETLFETWMSWDNRGNYKFSTWKDEDQLTWTWQIDHIIPHSTFKYTSMQDQTFKDCWSLTNLRPLSAKQNIIDGANKNRH